MSKTLEEMAQGCPTPNRGFREIATSFELWEKSLLEREHEIEIREYHQDLREQWLNDWQVQLEHKGVEFDAPK